MNKAHSAQPIVGSQRRSLLAATTLAGFVLATLPAEAASDTIAAMGALLASSASLPRPASTPATDLGVIDGATQIGLTFYLAPRNPATLAAVVAAVQTPGNPQFHKFLSVAQFDALFGPDTAAVANTTAIIEGMGFTVTHVTANGLAIETMTTAATASSVFGVELHAMSAGDRSGIVSTKAATIPAGLAASVRAVGGFDTFHRPEAASEPASPDAVPAGLTNIALAPSLGISDPPGQLTPFDYETLYDVRKLSAAATGAGVTIALVEEQKYFPDDAFTFWSGIGLDLPRSHLAHAIEVDGGAAATTPNTNINEPALDIEQAGAIARGATIQPYVSEGSSRAIVDSFAEIAASNTASVVSLSYDYAEIETIVGGPNSELAALRETLHDILSEMAVQGQTVFVSAGDAGAFAANRPGKNAYPVFPGVGAAPAFTPVYSIEAYSADPLVTACGGTMLPFTASYYGYAVDVPVERPWSTSALVLAELTGRAPLTSIVDAVEMNFPAGGGGGVSITWGVPAYQARLPGVISTLPGQALYSLAEPQPTLIASEPSGFAGRNTPDVSANSFGATGYRLIANGKTVTSDGGTSFVAPQFAGTAALIVQALGHRIGQLNPLLYALQAKGAAPAHDVVTGDNWGFLAHAGYDQATGLGTMDADRLYLGLRSYD